MRANTHTHTHAHTLTATFITFPLPLSLPQSAASGATCCGPIVRGLHSGGNSIRRENVRKVPRRTCPGAAEHLGQVRPAPATVQRHRG